MNARPKKIPKTVPMINSVSSSESESGVAEENKKLGLETIPSEHFSCVMYWIVRFYQL